VIVPLTAGRDSGASGASGPGEMGQGSLPTSNGITPRCGTRVPVSEKAALLVNLRWLVDPAPRYLRREASANSERGRELHFWRG